MKAERLAIPEVMVLTPRRFGDARGFFTETYNARMFAETTGQALTFVQDNLSFSAVVGTVRGLHFQTPPHAQDKLVTALRGSILDVAVDLRAGSPTYGRHVAVRLDADTGNQAFVPVGFAHGFCTLEPDTLVAYKVTDFYAPQHDSGLLWSDADLGIEWPITPDRACLSDKDAALPGFATFTSPFRYAG